MVLILYTIAILLTTWHMIFGAIATQVLARTTRLLNGRKAVHMTGQKYMRAVVPIGLVYSASLVCSNMPYLYLSVAFIQMLKVQLSPHLPIKAPRADLLPPTLPPPQLHGPRSKERADEFCL